ncbi:protein kinase domain-containing protein [Sorangium atrum]|uniref:AAA family ATPase n=1 Tax=Sorangium atrum TaxID=2995308 RepID=A0ABT5C1X0_9BACT|nr:AAA family ATPase [Sorangium aterium]MDC0680417.1 AAA family ATPase [Sorangium aterium]
MTSGAAYTLTGVIHESTATTVYRGVRESDRSPVAIKRLKSERPLPVEIAKLKYEYAIARDLALPGVVRVYGIEKVGSSLALIMEDAGERPLNEIIGASKLKLEDALRIAISIADVLESIHRRGVTHMDVKPHNILVDAETLQAKLTDFGSATRLSQEAHKASRFASFEGTLAYMSPEQSGRLNVVIDRRTDLYSLGVTLYEMVTGVLPFRTTDLMDLVHSHIARTPPAPHTVSPAVPSAVSDIVMKLLAKSPDDRYQSAHGLKVDLEECSSQLSSKGKIEPFPAGRYDYVDELRAPQKLYGRETEVALLSDAWGRTRQGGSESVLVSGYSGIGKSVLVNELQKSVVRERGYFATGKFDQLNRTTPYAAVAHVYQELLRNIMAEPAEALAQWKSRLGEAVGSNGQLLIDLIPELELLIGPQPAVQALGPTESQARFQLTLHNFCRAFPSKDRPLVLFFDDLQWADAASLKFLQTIAAEARIAYMLMIGAYRDNEVDASHLFSVVLGELRTKAAGVSELSLKPLAFSDVNQLVADTLSCDPHRAEPLARLIFDKTRGNPFFMSQLMKSLHAEKLLSFDPTRFSWTWDVDRIHEAKASENVIELMVGKMRRLPERAQRVLSLAACVGHQFDLTTLAIVTRRSRQEAARELWGVLREGFILPVDAESRFFDIAMDGELAVAEDGSGEELNVSYRFLHDRVQQAAYALMDDADKQAAHLQIGRLMLEDSRRDQSEAELFDIVGHMNRGVALITDERERRTLSGLNLDAGKRAKMGAAYDAAVHYLEVGTSLLDQESWKREYELTFGLHAELAECRCLNGSFEAAEPLLDVLSAQAKSTLDRANICVLRMTFFVMTGQIGKVISQALEALGLFGIDIPEGVEERDAMLRKELAAMRAGLEGREIAELIDLPPAASAETQKILSLLGELATPANAVDPTLALLAVVKQINLSMKHGNSAMSAVGYVTYGSMLVNDLPQLRGNPRRHEEGYAFAKLGIELNEKFNDIRLTCKLLIYFAAILHFFEHLTVAIDYFGRAREAGLASGDPVFSSFCCMHIAAAKLNLGDELDALAEEIEQNLALVRRIGDLTTIHTLICAKQVVANLTGRTEGGHSLSGGSFDEAEFTRSIEGPEFGYVASWYSAFKLQLSYLHGDYAAARSFLAAAERQIAGWSSHAWATEIVFFGCLTLAASCDAAPAGEREQHMEALARLEAKLRRWAELSPSNYAHKSTLVAGEVARLSGRTRDAMMLYEKAIDGARANRFVRDEAIANELAAKLYEGEGLLRSARAFMTDAYHAYLLWGATAKVESLARVAPHLVPPDGGLLGPRSVTASSSRSSRAQTTSTTRLSTSILDVEAVIRAAQALAGEVVLESVVSRLMEIVIKNSGAQKGALILDREQHLLVEAVVTAEPSSLRAGLAIPLEGSDDVPVSIVQYVARTREPVILADATQEPRFASDPYVAACAPRSILCLPMVHQGRTKGIIYLENRLAPSTFKPARQELVRLLLSQAGTAVENALLYEHLEHRTAALQEAEQRLGVEFAGRERSERARLSLQEEIIRVQNDRLAELSTPLIPITDRIMVMPLIGMMDRARAQQALSTALHGVESNGAEVVILDITGVKLVDTDVASTLMSTAKALRMLGAQAVLTGIRPEVATTLTGLQIEFKEIVTRGTLQSGIAYALQRTGRPEALAKSAAR